MSTCCTLRPAQSINHGSANLSQAIYAILLLVFAAASIVFSLSRRYGGLWVTGIGCVGKLVYTFFSIRADVSQATRSAGENIQRTLEAMFQLQWGWGWAVVLIGACLLLA